MVKRHLCFLVHWPRIVDHHFPKNWIEGVLVEDPCKIDHLSGETHGKPMVFVCSPNPQHLPTPSNTFPVPQAATRTQRNATREPPAPSFGGQAIGTRTVGLIQCVATMCLVQHVQHVQHVQLDRDTEVQWSSPYPSLSPNASKYITVVILGYLLFTDVCGKIATKCIKCCTSVSWTLMICRRIDYNERTHLCREFSNGNSSKHNLHKAQRSTRCKRFQVCPRLCLSLSII